MTTAHMQVFSVDVGLYIIPFSYRHGLDTEHHPYSYIVGWSHVLLPCSYFLFFSTRRLSSTERA